MAKWGWNQVNRSIIRGHEDFVPYLERRPPEQELSEITNWALRPLLADVLNGGVESYTSDPLDLCLDADRLMLPSLAGC